MPDPELKERVRALRERGRSPKEIARALKLPPATIAPLVRAIAAEAGPGSAEPVVAGCWVSAGWASGLTVHGRPDWPSIDAPGYFDELGPSGLVTVLVAVERGGSKVAACGYLVDVYCLGVKNALGPRGVDRRKLPEFVHQYFRTSSDDPPLAAPLDLARHLVLGAVAYARNLGFEPHPDFEAAAASLEPWTGPSAISFGRDGRPFFVQGPYDDPASIMKTLKRSVGKGNFDIVAAL
jgi:hypothetical protein